MGYYDGNTVTALWNYAQHYTLSDNFFDTTFGTTVMGHMTLISGQTHGVNVEAGTASTSVINNGSIIGNVQPYYDDCAAGSTPNVVMTGMNVGDLLNTANVSWAWFYGDFAATSAPGTIPATCISIYNSHYAPFDYYQDTSNPHHIPPSSVAAIGTDTCSNQKCANHNYDLSYFAQALNAGNLPAGTYIEFSEADTGHPSELPVTVETRTGLEASPGGGER